MDIKLTKEIPSLNFKASGELKMALNDPLGTVGKVEEKTRYIQIKIKNLTQFQIERTTHNPSEFFSTGKVFSFSSIIKSNEIGELNVANRDWAFMHGVSGAVKYLLYDEMSNQKLTFLTIGFSNPYMGLPKLYAEFNEHPETTWKKITDSPSGNELFFNGDNSSVVVECFPGAPHAEVRLSQKN